MTRPGVVIALLLSLSIMSACADPAADKAKAVTGEATAASPQPEIQGERYLIAPENSKIEFVGSKVSGSEAGSFKDFSGVIEYSGKPESGKVSVTIKMSSVATDAKQLTEHLQSPDFFDVAKFPESTFTSTEIRAGGDKGASHTVMGNFQLHGITKSISFPATISGSQDAVTVESTFAINRKDFGIIYTGAADNLIRDQVVLTLHVKAEKAK